MKALILDAENKTAHVKDVCRPVPCSGEVLIKVDAVALNPVDAIYVAHPLGSTGRIVGSDFAGTVVSLGDSHTVAQEGCMNIGDRVAGFVQGAGSVNERPGAFAEYVVSPWDLLWKYPQSISPGEAAGINLCALTAAQVVFYRLGLKAPFSWKETPEVSSTDGDDDAVSFFIYGASTSVGQYAAQLLHRSVEASGQKIKLIGAASRARFDMLHSEPYNYDYLVDYRDKDWPEQVRALTNDKGVQYAYDCISEGDSVQLVSRTVAKDGKMAIMRSRQGGAWKTEDLPLEPIYGAVWEGLGEEIHYAGFIVPASPSARAFAAAFFRWLCDGGK